MTYPATNFEEAVSNTITSSDQLHQVINGSVTDTVTTDSGEIPSVRKALTDNMYFVEAIPWVQGGNETVFNQLRTFTDNVVYWAPNATVSDPVPMGATPDGDSNWTLAPVSLTEDKIRQVSSEIANAGDSQLAGGKIWPVENTDTKVNDNPVSVTFFKLTDNGVRSLYRAQSPITGTVNAIGSIGQTVDITIDGNVVTLIKVRDNFSMDVTDFGAISGVNDESTRELNRMATEKMMLATGGKARWPTGTFFTNPISSNIVETYTNPVFIGESVTEWPNNPLNSVINTNGQDFYYGGTKTDYDYIVEKLVFDGGENTLTAKFFGSDVTTGVNREHRGTFRNVTFIHCDKGLYTEDFSSSVKFYNCMFRRARFGHFCRRGGSHSVYKECRVDFCNLGVYTGGFHVTFDNIHIGLGVVNGEFSGRQRALSFAGYVTLNETYVETYGFPHNNTVPYTARLFDPDRVNIIMNNCGMHIDTSENDIDVVMDYNNGDWAWPENWLTISKVTNNDIPRIRVGESINGSTNTRLIQGVSVGDNQGLSVSEKYNVAYFNSRQLYVDLSLTSGIELAPLSGHGVTFQKIMYPKSAIKWVDLFINGDDTTSSGALWDADKAVRFGYAGRYRFSGATYIPVPSMSVGDKWAIAIRWRKGGAYKVTVIESGTVLDDGGTPVINTSMESTIMDSDGPTNFFWGFVSSDGYKSPTATEFNGANTECLFELTKIAPASNVTGDT